MTTCNLLTTEREKRSLECSICLERLRNPKTLPCLHSYCEECLINYTPEGTKSMRCPQCKEQFDVPEGGAVNFKSNYHLKELVEEVALRTEMLEPRVKLMCNCCKREETPSEAIARCLDCNQYLCSSGKAAHRRFSALTEHVVATIDEIRSGKVRPKSIQKQDAMCMKHPRNKAEIFCLTCELPICHVCATLKHKSPDHECVEAAEAMETRRQLVKQSLDELERVKAQFEDVTTRVDAMKHEVMAQTVKLQAQINESYNDLLLRAEKEKIALMKEIDDTSEKELNELQKRSESAEAHMTYITGIQSQAESTTEEASDGNFLSMYDTVKTKIDQLCLKTPDDLKEMDIRELNQVDIKPNSLLLGKILSTINLTFIADELFDDGFRIPMAEEIEGEAPEEIEYKVAKENEKPRKKGKGEREVRAKKKGALGGVGRVDWGAIEHVVQVFDGDEWVVGAAKHGGRVDRDRIAVEPKKKGCGGWDAGSRKGVGWGREERKMAGLADKGLPLRGWRDDKVVDGSWNSRQLIEPKKKEYSGGSRTDGTWLPRQLTEPDNREISDGEW